MKVIITGATGCIGRNMAERFHAEGMAVLATGRSQAVGQALMEQGIPFRRADLLDANEVAESLAPADCVIHCAAKTGDWGSYKQFHDTNVIGTRNVIAACARHGIHRIIFLSSPSLYFTGRDRLNIRESEPLPTRQLSAYAQTKVLAERDILALRNDGRRVMVFRPRAVYGPYDRTILPRILRLAEKKRMPLINNGRALIDITCVENLVDAVRLGLSAPEAAWNEVYNISNGDPIRARDWFAQVLEIFGRPFSPKSVPESAAKAVALFMELAARLPFGPRKPAMTRFAVGYMAKSMTLCIDKAREKLGYSPSVGNRKGFEQYAEWLETRSPHAVAGDL